MSKKKSQPARRKTAKDIPVILSSGQTLAVLQFAAKAAKARNDAMDDEVEKTEVKGPDGSKQHLIPGTGPMVVPLLDSLCDDMRGILRRREALAEERTEVEDKAVAEMRARDLATYEHDGVVLTCEFKTKLSVKVLTPDDGSREE